MTREGMADMFSVEGPHREERIKKYAELFGITDSLGNLVSSYSYGMKQKLALIGAFLHELLAVLNRFDIRLPPYIFIFQYPDLSDPTLSSAPFSFSFLIRPKTAFLPISNLFAIS